MLIYLKFTPDISVWQSFSRYDFTVLTDELRVLMRVGWRAATEHHQRRIAACLNAMRRTGFDANRVADRNRKLPIAQGHQAGSGSDMIELLGRVVAMQ